MYTMTELVGARRRLSCCTIKSNNVARTVWRDGALTWRNLRQMPHGSVWLALPVLIYTAIVHAINFFFILLNYILAARAEKPTPQHTVQIHCVLARHKMDMMRLSAYRDFITTFQR